MKFAAFLARVEACTVFILRVVAVCCCAFFELVFYENRVMVDTHHGGQDEKWVDFTIKMGFSITCMVRNVKC